MWSGLPLVISLILTPITSSYAQHTQETLASFPFPECSRHMLLPWNLYHADPFLQNVFLSHVSTYLFSHLFLVLVICFHLDLSVSYWNLLCPQIHTRSFPLGSTFFSYILITFEHSIQFTYSFFLLFMFCILSLKHKTLKKWCHWQYSYSPRQEESLLRCPHYIPMVRSMTHLYPQASF